MKHAHHRTEGDDARALLDRLIRERGEDYAAMSRLIGRNSAYIQQYIKRGTPRKLDEEDRRILAEYFGVAESSLASAAGAAGADSASIKDISYKSKGNASALVPIRRLDVRASAGPGALPDRELVIDPIGFHASWLRDLTGSRPELLSTIRVSGDSMAPTLADGDDILVDGGDGAGRLRDGIYVLRLDDMLVVKRLAWNPATQRIVIISDNPGYPAMPECDPSAIHVIGRVIWIGRRLG